MPLDDEFCDSPYRFMQKHVLQVEVSDHFEHPLRDVAEVFVIENPYNSGVVDPPHPESKACLLGVVGDPGWPHGDPPPSTREVYWCHYAQDKAFPVMLGRRHSYMFTPRMTGCTLGVGSDGGDGTIRVAHANAGTFGQTQGTDPESSLHMQTGAQRTMLDSVVGDVAKVVSPYVYMRSDGAFDFRVKATTFGRREVDRGWQFYSHSYLPGGQGYRHCGVRNSTQAAHVALGM